MASTVLTIGMVSGLVATEFIPADWGMKTILAIIIGILYWTASRYFNSYDQRLKRHEAMCDDHIKKIQQLEDFKRSDEEIMQLFGRALIMSLGNGFGKWLKETLDERIDLALIKHSIIKKQDD
jgi:hypothetical protein